MGSARGRSSLRNGLCIFPKSKFDEVAEHCTFYSRFPRNCCPEKVQIVHLLGQLAFKQADIVRRHHSSNGNCLPLVLLQTQTQTAFVARLQTHSHTHALLQSTTVLINTKLHSIREFVVPFFKSCAIWWLHWLLIFAKMFVESSWLYCGWIDEWEVVCSWVKRDVNAAIYLADFMVYLWFDWFRLHLNWDWNRLSSTELFKRCSRLVQLRLWTNKINKYKNIYIYTHTYTYIHV